MGSRAGKIADIFIPPDMLNDPLQRRSVMKFRGVSRMLMICIAVELGFFLIICSLVDGWDYYIEIGAVVMSTVCVIVSLVLMRFLRSFSLPLAIANGGTLLFFAAGVLASGGISSPLIFLFLTLPALSISFGSPLIFRSICIVTGAFFVLVYGLQIMEIIPGERPGGINPTFYFLYFLGAFTLCALGGMSAQLSSGQARKALREKNRQLEKMAIEVKQSNADLEDKNLMLEALSGKLAKYLSPQVFSSIFEGKQDVKVGAQRKKLTVYFSDIVDFTATTDAMEAEEMSALMNEYFDEMARIIIRHGGTIDKYMGDAIMVFFGDPDTQGDVEDARACVSMALEMQERLESLQKQWQRKGIERPLQMRAGINTGYCTVGNFGSENRMDYTIIGGQVNIAARLEQAAIPGEILISHQTHALVGDMIVYESHGELDVKGVSEPVKAYQVNALKQQDGKVDVIDHALDGLSLYADFSKITENDRSKAVKLLSEALDRLNKTEVHHEKAEAQ
jgi:class 3 adenylate cyclase